MPREASGLPAIADDSGLEVDALHGAPGIYSARYAGAAADDEANNRKLLRELEDVADAERTARYRCAMAYLRWPQRPGADRLPGELGRRGSAGCRAAAADSATTRCSSSRVPRVRLPSSTRRQKNRVSHRGLALRALVAALGGAVREP